MTDWRERFDKQNIDLETEKHMALLQRFIEQELTRVREETIEECVKVALKAKHLPMAEIGFMTPPELDGYMRGLIAAAIRALKKP